MQQPLILREITIDELDTSFEQLTEGYLHVRTTSLLPKTILPFDIYFPALAGSPKRLQLQKVVSVGTIYRQELHDRFTDDGIDGVYISGDKEALLLDYTINNIKRLIPSLDIPLEQKTQILYDSAEIIIKKVFKERPSRSNIIIGRQFVVGFAEHLSSDQLSAKILLSLFSKDYSTFSHSVQVALLGMTFCSFLGWKNEQVTGFGLGALFHDVGKNAIDERILNKPSRLEKEEFEIIKKHPLLGYHQLKNAQTMSREQLTVALHHHEAMDGSGYPHGLKGNATHKFARVARLIDCFDALTTKRVYKEALPAEQALRIMNNEMGDTFDPDYLKGLIAFLQMNPEANSVTPSNRMSIELGSRIMIQLDQTIARSKAVLVGMEVDKYLILRVPGLELIQKQLCNGNGQRVIARYISSGIVYGFRSQVLNYLLSPAQLLFLTYPRIIENVNLRKDPRFKVDLPMHATIRGKIYAGRVVDLSGGGCKISLLVPTPDITLDLIDEQVVLNMHLVEDHRLEELACKVRNLNASSKELTIGMQFTTLSGAQTADLRLLLDTSIQKGHQV